MDGEIDGARTRAWTIDDVLWEWQPDGTPWIDPLKEVKASIEEIAGGINSPQRICKRRGLDFKTVIDEIAEAGAYAASKGVALSYVPISDPDLAKALTEEKEDD